MSSGAWPNIAAGLGAGSAGWSAPWLGRLGLLAPRRGDCAPRRPGHTTTDQTRPQQTTTDQMTRHQGVYVEHTHTHAHHTHTHTEVLSAMWCGSAASDMKHTLPHCCMCQDGVPLLGQSNNILRLNTQWYIIMRQLMIAYVRMQEEIV